MKKWLISLLALGLASQALAVGGGSFSYWLGFRYNRQPIYYIDQGGAHAGKFQDTFNWFTTSGGATHVSHIPQAHDYVVISYFPTDWTDCFNTVTLTGFDFFDTGSVPITACSFSPITIEKTGSVKPTGYLRIIGGSSVWDGHNEAGASLNFYGTSSSTATILGDANFNEGSQHNNPGTVSGNCVFRNGSDNFGRCGTADFYNTTTNNRGGGGVTGHANFYNNSVNNGVYGTADFWNTSSNAECGGDYSQGYTALHDSSTNNTALANVDFYDSSGNLGGCNPLGAGGAVTFNGSSYNNAGANGPVFNGSSQQNGWSNTTTIMNATSNMANSAYSSGALSAYGSSTIHGALIGGGDIHDSVVFASDAYTDDSNLTADGSASVQGNVYGDATFSGTSELNAIGAVSGHCTFTGASNKFGTCGSTTCATSGVCTP